MTNPSVKFFNDQFTRQIEQGDFILNDFENLALPYLQGEVLDFGCGLGNLSIQAALKGCTVLSLDASSQAIANLQAIQKQSGLAIEAREADLRDYRLQKDFDVIVCIGLLMFFDCDTAFRQLKQLQERVKPEGILVLNVLVEGTTFYQMFDPQGYCLFEPNAILSKFADWEIVVHNSSQYESPQETQKRFITLIAKKSNPSVPTMRHWGTYALLGDGLD